MGATALPMTAPATRWEHRHSARMSFHLLIYNFTGHSGSYSHAELEDRPGAPAAAPAPLSENSEDWCAVTDGMGTRNKTEARDRTGIAIGWYKYARAARTPTRHAPRGEPILAHARVP